MSTHGNGPVISLFSNENDDSALARKLKHELDVLDLFTNSFCQDICSVLTLTNWSDNVMVRLLQTPNLLREVAIALSDDDMYAAFLEERTRTLVLQLIGVANGLGVL